MNVKLLTKHHLKFLSLKGGAAQAHLSLHMSKCHIVGNQMLRLNYAIMAIQNSLYQTRGKNPFVHKWSKSHTKSPVRKWGRESYPRNHQQTLLKHLLYPSAERHILQENYQTFSTVAHQQFLKKTICVKIYIGRLSTAIAINKPSF